MPTIDDVFDKSTALELANRFDMLLLGPAQRSLFEEMTDYALSGNIFYNSQGLYGAYEFINGVEQFSMYVQDNIGQAHFLRFSSAPAIETLAQKTAIMLRTLRPDYYKFDGHGLEATSSPYLFIEVLPTTELTDGSVDVREFSTRTRGAKMIMPMEQREIFQFLSHFYTALDEIDRIR